ncbi:MAG: prolipoprotein diacylglyceryl transferase [Candidatus Altimarinota bacterium]
MQSSIFEISILGISIAPKWYGLMYALSFIICYQFMKKWSKFSSKEMDSLLFYVFFGVILGGRLGYVIFYNLPYFIENPSEIFFIWQGGMSFHGGLIGVLISIYFFCGKYKKTFFSVTDPLSVIIPLALGLGRLGNFINQELLGFFPYSGPFAIVKNGASYFPSPLFEMLLEGGMLFIIMLLSSKKIGFFSNTSLVKKYGTLSGIFLLGYGSFRLIAENFRLPDEHIGYLFQTNWITLGMIYTLPLILLGSAILYNQRNTITK